MVQFFQRTLRVFLLDKRVFEAVGADKNATLDAVIIVTIVAIVSAIAAAISTLLFAAGFGLVNMGLGASEFLLGEVGFRLPTLNPVGAFVSTFFGAYVSWILWSLTTYVVGVFLFNGDTTFGEMLRILGFAQAPLALRGLAFFPGISWVVSLIAWVWAMAAAFVGIRQGLELSTGKTILTIVLSMIVIILTNRFLLGPLTSAIF
jgi:hypothetical protein